MSAGRLKSDSHSHLFTDGFFGAPGSRVGVHEYEQLRDIGGIDEALVLGYEGDELYRGNNSYIRELAQTRSWIRPLYYLDARVAPAAKTLTQIREEGFVGFALYLNEGNPALEGWSEAALRALADDSAIVSINANPESLSHARQWISTMTSCSVLISHLGLPGPAADPEPVKSRLAPLLEFENLRHVSVKLSGLYAIDPKYPYLGAAPYVEQLLHTFGSKRLMWGSDFSPAMGFGSPAQVSSLPGWLDNLLAPDERDEVAGANLRRALARTTEHLG